MSYEPIDDDGREVRLSRPRPCEWCGETMMPGATAIVRVYRLDGSYRNARQHPECFAAMRDWLLDALNDTDDGFRPGRMTRGRPWEKGGAA